MISSEASFERRLRENLCEMEFLWNFVGRGESRRRFYRTISRFQGFNDSIELSKTRLNEQRHASDTLEKYAFNFNVCTARVFRSTLVSSSILRIFDCVYVSSLCVYIYIYIYIPSVWIFMCVCMSLPELLYIHIYVYSTFASVHRAGRLAHSRNLAHTVHQS